jgi:hypothetical protein
MIRRRRFKQTASLQARLSAFARDVREQAARLPPGIEREDMLRKARQAHTAAHLDNWANSIGLQPPK